MRRHKSKRNHDNDAIKAKGHMISTSPPLHRFLPLLLRMSLPRQESRGGRRRHCLGASQLPREAQRRLSCPARSQQRAEPPGHTQCTQYEGVEYERGRGGEGAAGTRRDDNRCDDDNDDDEDEENDIKKESGW
jgi:hypothetical protein